MSHFTVLVIGDDIEAQLQPFHEFECTGTSDQYVQDIDETEEKREELKTETRAVVRLASGELVSAYDDRWYRPALPGDEYSGGRFGMVRELPAGVVEFEAPFESVEAWADYHGHKLVKAGETPDINGEHKYGYVLLDEAGGIAKAVRRTNPNRKWDWWQLGGRWSGFFHLKPGAIGTVGRRGLMGSCSNTGAGFADQARKGDIDFEAKRAKHGADAAALWDKAHALTGGQSWESWESVRTRMSNIDEARNFYHSQPAIKALKEGDRDAFGWELDDSLSGPRDAFIAAARDQAITTWAVLHRGEWSEKGCMGWFGMSSGDMRQSEWNRLFNELVDGLPDDTLLSVVDCHI